MFAPLTDPAGGTLRASRIGAVRGQLSAALEVSSGLDDAGRVESITALEELVRVATAAQAALARELDVSQRSAQAAAGVRAEHRGRGVALQVALARRESHHRGRRHLGLAKVVATELPHTWAAWCQGKVTEFGVTLAVRETACLEVEDRLEVDRLLAADPGAVEVMSERDIASFCAKHAARLDPASVVERRRRAEEERCVTLRPAPDTMTYLTALLPVKDGVAAYAALTQAADSARADGTDERTKGQVMADTLVARVLGGHQPSAASGGPKVRLGLVMPIETVFGASDDSAHLDGYGPVPAELGREILAGALDADDEVWLRRLYTSPATGELVTMDSTARRFAGGLARFIRLRDQVCRTPWCTAPVRHGDHADAAAGGGPTTAENGQGLCEACNYAKQAPGWWARPGPDGTIETTTPTGHRHRTRPPALVTIHQAAPVRIDYVPAA